MRRNEVMHMMKILERKFQAYEARKQVGDLSQSFTRFAENASKQQDPISRLRDSLNSHAKDLQHRWRCVPTAHSVQRIHSAHRAH